MIEKILDDFREKAFEEKVELFNSITQKLYDFIGIEHPALNVQLVKSERLIGNDYTPNRLPPPEMELLKRSLHKDGFTMPVLICDSPEEKEQAFTIVDGAYRAQLARDDEEINKSLKGHIPVSRLNKGKPDCIATSVRHNMARGTAQVERLSSLIALLKKHNWADEEISVELGMDLDEVLRLKQFTGLAAAFSNQAFSPGWEIEPSKKDK